MQSLKSHSTPLKMILMFLHLKILKVLGMSFTLFVATPANLKGGGGRRG